MIRDRWGHTGTLQLQHSGPPCFAKLPSEPPTPPANASPAVPEIGMTSSAGLETNDVIDSSAPRSEASGRERERRRGTCRAHRPLSRRTGSGGGAADESDAHLSGSDDAPLRRRCCRRGRCVVATRLVWLLWYMVAPVTAVVSVALHCWFSSRWIYT